MHVYICIYERMRRFLPCTWLSAYPNYVHIKLFVKTVCKWFQRKKTAQIGTDVTLAYVMPDCWLEVSLYPEVLRMANSIKVFRGFPLSQSKC
jgi:hypothetical protein